MLTSLRRTLKWSVPSLFVCLGMSLVAATQQTHINPSTTSQGLTFEVASIRSAKDSPYINTILTYPGGRVVAKGATLRFLLTEAYTLQPYQITGGPAWLDTTQFDIEAKPSTSVAAKYTDVSASPKFPLSGEQRRMLQNLLSERFQLRSHIVNSDGPVYILSRESRPLKLETPKDPSAFHWAGGMAGGAPNSSGIKGTNISMAEFAARLSGWLNRPVEDKTGLAGNFDFSSLTSEANDQATSFEVETDIVQSVKTIGLDLKKGTGEVPKLIIDSVSEPTKD